jgi:hypothetical protein
VSVFAAAALACEAAQLGWPPVPLQARSPDGRIVAFVRNHPEFDPPNQSLWIQATGDTPSKLAQLAPDQDWCDRIVWSSDSRRVAFLVSDAIVYVYDGQSHEQVFSGFIGRRSWDTPPRYIPQDLALSSDGSSVRFRECERTWKPSSPARQNSRGTRVDRVISGCSETRTVTLADVPRGNLLAPGRPR